MNFCTNLVGADKAKIMLDASVLLDHSAQRRSRLPRHVGIFPEHWKSIAQAAERAAFLVWTKAD
jgi:hypothetical protein